MKSRRILLIIVFILLVIAFGALIYFVFLRDIVQPTNTNDNTNQSGNLPTNTTLPNTNIVNGVPTNTISNANSLVNTRIVGNVNIGPSQIADGGETRTSVVEFANAQGFTATPDGNSLRYYDRDTGQFYLLDALGNRVLLSDNIFPQAESISWSPADNRAIITFPDGRNIIYDFDREDQISLPSSWNDITFSPGGDALGFKNDSDVESERWLAVSADDGSEVRAIEPLGDQANNVDVNWSPTGQVLATYREALNGTAQQIILIGTQGENFKSITTTGRGFEGTWSPSGSQLLYSVYSSDTRFNPVLYLVDATGDNVGANTINLGLQTWSSKCTFAHTESAAYCAVPRFLPDGSGIVPEAAVDTNDTFYKIDLQTGQRTPIAIPTLTTGDSDYTATNLVVSGTDQVLYFTDANTGNIFSFRLR